MTTHLAWFRQDLRLHDNLALAAACRNSSARVLALYIATPRQWETHNMSPRQAELINAQLNGLQIALAEKGIPLLFREVDDFVASVEIVKQVCAE
ncbi:TPA: deoxyribodipyrimidine photo-lyase, partial [Shigella flexneri]|nr:deoxyribodipyrimidine photo-lyase [Shigella flexneri]